MLEAGPGALRVLGPVAFWVRGPGNPGRFSVVAPGEQHRWRYKLEVTVTGEDVPILSLDPEVIIVKKPITKE